MQKKDLLKMFAHLLCELPSENETDKKLDLVLSKLEPRENHNGCRIRRASID